MKPATLSVRRPLARGVTLIEALVALMVMSFGMVALVTLMGNLRRSADVAKQRSEAVRLAQADLAEVRAFYTLTKPAANTTEIDYEDGVVSTSRSTTLDDSNTTFAISRDVTELTTGGEIAARSVQVSVSWRDRASTASEALQTLDLTTLVARVEPAFSGALSIAPPPGAIRPPQDRHPAIPLSASDLGNKRSAFRPSSLHDRVWIFNNLTGFITQTCDIKPATALTLADVAAAGCTDVLGFLVSGTINFSNTNPANPRAPEAKAQPLGLSIVGGTFNELKRDPNGVPVNDSSGKPIIEVITATPPSHQCFNDSPTTPPQAFVNYSCIVVPSGSVRPSWSGSLRLTGLSIGTSASQYRVCRYSADYNGNGSPYANAAGDLDNYEHPAVYARVNGSLPRQNFLVVKGDVNCPTAPAVNLSTGVFADYSTVQLQP